MTVGWALYLVVCGALSGVCTEVPVPSLEPMTHLQCLILGAERRDEEGADSFVCRLEREVRT